MTLERAAVADLVDTLGADRVITEPAAMAPYSADWSGRFKGAAAAVLRPSSTEDVAATVVICRRHGLALVPQGGNTGLVGGSVPLAGEVVLSMLDLDDIGPTDDNPGHNPAGQIEAGGGVTLAAIHEAARRSGRAYGVDFASRQQATLGGSIATNAGGLHVLRYGDTRAQVLGVEAVLGDGSVVSHLGGLIKDNTGYHLPSLLCGSEGTLGVVTRARLSLVPACPKRASALVAFASVDDAVTAAALLRRSVPSLNAAELMFAAGVELVCRVTGLPPPLPQVHPVLLIVEAAGQADPAGELEAGIGALAGVAEVALLDDPGDAARLWRYREAHTTSVGTLGAPHKLDVTLPLGRLATFIAEVPAAVAAIEAGARTWLWGHAADGNIHVNVTGVEPGDERVDAAVLEMVAGLGGSISAEHGIGTAKREWLHLNRSVAEIEAFTAIKRALDPDSILNPNALLPALP